MYHCQGGQGRPVWGEAHGTVRTTVKLVRGGLYGGGHMELYVPLSRWSGEACMGGHMELYVPLSRWSGEACMGGGTWNCTYHCQVGQGRPVWGGAHGTVRTTVKVVRGGLYGGRHMELYVPLSSWSGEACMGGGHMELYVPLSRWSGEACMGGGTWNCTYHCQVGQGRPVWGEAHGAVHSQRLSPDTVSVPSASSCSRPQQLTHLYRAHSQCIGGNVNYPMKNGYNTCSMTNYN